MHCHLRPTLCTNMWYMQTHRQVGHAIGSSSLGSNPDVVLHCSALPLTCRCRRLPEWGIQFGKSGSDILKRSRQEIQWGFKIYWENSDSDLVYAMVILKKVFHKIIVTRARDLDSFLLRQWKRVYRFPLIEMYGIIGSLTSSTLYSACRPKMNR